MYRLLRRKTQLFFELCRKFANRLNANQVKENSTRVKFSKFCYEVDKQGKIGEMERWKIGAEKQLKRGKASAFRKCSKTRIFNFGLSVKNK